MSSSNFSLLLLILFIVGCTQEESVETDLQPIDAAEFQKNGDLTERTQKQTSELHIFMPAGALGGPDNLLTPGDFFPPTKGSKVSLKRGSNYIQFNLHTTGLPPGAYTVWYVIFNDPGDCGGPGIFGGDCGEADLFLPNAAVVWATGKVVKSNGVGNFSDRLYVGELRSETVLLGSELSYPLEDPAGCEVHLIIKYHGAASEDPEVLYAQLSTLLGSCGPDEGANSFDAGPVFGIQCFDPQFAIFPGL